MIRIVKGDKKLTDYFSFLLFVLLQIIVSFRNFHIFHLDILIVIVCAGLSNKKFPLILALNSLQHNQ